MRTCILPQPHWWSPKPTSCVRWESEPTKKHKITEQEMVNHAGRLFVTLICLLGSIRPASAADKPPRSLDKRLKIELFAEHPQIVTPTGIDVDHKGRVWAIESNTHFPPDGYQGHPSDRVLVMQDTDGDHKADKINVFTDGLTHTMSIAVKPVWLKSPESRAKQSPRAAPRGIF